jgi:predicted metalloprotease with PDZ domain
VPWPQLWIDEGLATYLEPVARARAGDVDVKRFWRDLVEGLPQGLPGPGDRGLDHTHTWGRTYWGGALFCLLADVEIRERTHNARSLDDAVRGILAAGGNIAAAWPLERALAAGDAAIGVPVLRELREKLGARAGTTDLPALWQRLGVRVQDGDVHFDDGAPLAAIRRAITAP